MSEVAPPHVRVAIFHKAAFFEDHFLKGWNFTSTPTLNGQTVTLNAGQFAEYPANFNTASKRYLVYRVVAGSDFVFQIRRASDNVWIHASVGYEPGEWVTDLQAIINGDVNGVRFYAASGSVSVDYLAVVEGFRVPQSSDLTEDLEVNLSLLKDGFAGAKITITNFNEQADPYDSEIDKGDYVLVWLARSAGDLGKTEFKVFGGRVINPVRQYNRYGIVVLMLDCHGHAAELNAPPALLRKVYSGTQSKIIAEDALALCRYLAPHPDSSKWFAGTNQNHSVDYDEVKPLTVIQETAEKAGFDVYETADGALIAHTKLNPSFTSPVTPLLRNAVKGDDLHPVRNRIKVYGAQNKRLPSDGDQWTEAQALMWTAEIGSFATHGEAHVGNYALALEAGTNPNGKVLVTAVILWEGSQNYPVGSFKFGYGKGSFKNVHFFWRYYAGLFGSTMTTEEIRLYTDPSNYFYATIKHNSNGGSWQEETIALGSANEWDPAKDVDDQGNPVAVNKWRKIGNPNWTTINKIGFYAEGSSADMAMYIDGLYFDGAECSGEAEDPESQAVYGLRVAEPVSDATLLTDAECRLKAESLLAKLKAPELTLKEVVVDGDHRFRPGDRISLLGVTFRIEQVRHIVKGTVWDVVLKVGLV